ncbi:MAG: flagellar hook-associated protein FlgK [Candidatus Zixiibacteriota bacterium]|nr:MAG: flagellar hook-associated protein FlgK [candidate division Zixibacteria bacterium]
MAGLFDAISQAKRSLMAQQWAQMTTGHNIANVNTVGYSRQRAELAPALQALEVPGGLIGMGADVEQIVRMRDRYIDRQVLAERQNHGFLNFKSTTLGQVETILGETSGYGLSGMLDEFWACWSDLANDPENSAARVALQQKGMQLAQKLNTLDSDLANQQRELDMQLSGMVGQINQLAGQIASLNTSISTLVGQGVVPNDLMDQRDLLVEQLSGLANVTVQDEGDGTLSVWLGGQTLVYRDNAQQMNLELIPGSAADLHRITWAHNGMEVEVQSGEMAGLLLVRDEAIPELLAGLDQFAVGLAENVNALHLTGYALSGATGLNFFDPNTTGAGNIALSAEVTADEDNIAASGDGSAGDGSIALALFDLQNQLVMDDGTATLNQFYAALAADLGALTQSAQNDLYESDTALQQLENWKLSAEGVSLDEEMANMVRYQQAYVAVSKFVGTVNEMLTTLLSI